MVSELASILDGLFQPGAAFGTNSPETQAQAPNGLLANLALGLSRSILAGIRVPGDIYANQTPMTSDQMVAPAADMVNLLVGGGMPLAERGALGMAGGKLRLPSSASLATPPAPSAADMLRASSIESVPLAQARGTQSKMQWDKFNAGESPPPLIEGYADKPVAVRREDGEYLIFDGHHRAAKALNDGSMNMDMHVINAKDYAPEFAGRKPAPDTTDMDALLRALLKDK